MKHLVYVGHNGFPSGFAQVERQKLIAKALVESGVSVTVINRYGVHSKRTDRPEIPPNGYVDNINFIYASGHSYREAKFMKRNWLKIKGLFNEIRIIGNLKKQDKADAILITSNSFFNVLFYGAIGYYYKIVSLLDYVEYWKSRYRGNNISKVINNLLYDKYSFRYVSKVIVISDFLKRNVKLYSPDKALVKIPVIVDYDKINRIGIKKSQKRYFLYCAGAGYAEVIEFVIKAFDLLDEDIDLVIVVHGDKRQLKSISELIEYSMKRNRICLKTDLTYEDLIEFYKSAAGLLIPLRDSVQDTARFPHKIGEYCASHRPIISTEIGEMTTYFKDKQNALLAEKYDCKEYAEKMKLVIENDSLANALAEKSYQLGKDNFDYRNYGKKLCEFIFA